MPRLITTDRPQAPRITPATPDDFGAAKGRALGGLGRTVSASSREVEQALRSKKRIEDAAAQANARRKATEFDIELGTLTNEVSLNPDVGARKKQFEEGSRVLSARHRPTGSFASTFDQESRISMMRHNSSLSQQITRDHMENGLADSDFRVNALAEQAVGEDNPEERALSTLQAEIELEESLGQGFITQGQHDKKLRAVRKQVDDGILHRFTNADPVGGLDYLKSPQFTGTIEEKEVWRSKMLKKVESDLAADRKISTSARAAEKAERDDLNRKAVKSFIDKASPDGEGLTMEDVEATGSFLTESNRLQYTKIAIAGGKIKAPIAADPKTISALRKRAMLGSDETVIEDATKSYIESLIGLADLRAIETLHTDATFRPGAEILDSAVDALLARSSGQPIKIVAATQGTLEYDQWVIEHPKATRAEALQQATLIYTTLDLGGQIKRSGAARRKGEYLVGLDGETDIDATLKDVARRLRRGVISEEAATDIEIEMQELKDAREDEAAISSRLPGGGP